MNRKKYIIILFIAVFALSSTGLPLTVHYCEMMNSSSIEECEMCSVEVEDVSSCCSIELPGVKLSDQKKGGCCETKIIGQPLQDDYVQSSVKSSDSNDEVQLIQTETINLFNYFKSFEVENTSHSPPLIAQNLFIINSALLI